MRSVTIKINKRTGEIEMESHGYEGSSECATALDRLEHILSSQFSEQSDKEEYVRTVGHVKN